VRSAHLDHPRRVIQITAPDVLKSMQCGPRCHLPPVLLLVAPMWQLASAEDRDRRSLPIMPAEAEILSHQAQWARLIGAIATHQDRAAFAGLFEYFAPRVKTYMQRSGATEARAEELAQETMLTVWRKAALFNPSSAGADAWIFAIARNLRIDAFRREQRGGAMETSEIEAEFQIDASPLPDSLLAAAQSDEQVRAALTGLSPDQMRVIELSFFEEKAHAEIAQILEIPLGTVKSRLRLAMNRLRSLLSEAS
jgi:RNA polymerase sigma-70 factor (ECF subfamily)